MSHSMLQPLIRAEQASAAQTATGQTSTIVLPQARSYVFLLDVTTSSTVGDETLDVDLQISPQSPGTPTAWYSVARFRQVQGSAQGAQTVKDVIRISGDGGPGEAGFEFQIPGSGGTGPVAINLPLTRKIRFKWTIVGSAPSFTFAIFGIYAPKGSLRL